MSLQFVCHFYSIYSFSTLLENAQKDLRPEHKTSESKTCLEFHIVMFEDFYLAVLYQKLITISLSNRNLKNFRPKVSLSPTPLPSDPYRTLENIGLEILRLIKCTTSTTALGFGHLNQVDQVLDSIGSQAQVFSQIIGTSQKLKAPLLSWLNLYIACKLKEISEKNDIFLVSTTLQDFVERQITKHTHSISRNYS